MGSGEDLGMQNRQDLGGYIFRCLLAGMVAIPIVAIFSLLIGSLVAPIFGLAFTVIVSAAFVGGVALALADAMGLIEIDMADLMGKDRRARDKALCVLATMPFSLTGGLMLAGILHQAAQANGTLLMCPTVATTIMNMRGSLRATPARSAAESLMFPALCVLAMGAT